jgi:hypothetical protein
MISEAGPLEFPEAGFPWPIQVSYACVGDSAAKARDRPTKTPTEAKKTIWRARALLELGKRQLPPEVLRE